MEQRCLLLDRNIAFQNFKILALKSEIESLDAKYQADLRQLRSDWEFLLSLDYYYYYCSQEKEKKRICTMFEFCF